jgi:hypothetical protein
MSAELRAALEPALNAYSAALAEHGHAYTSRTPKCVCGYPSRTRQGVGRHISTARKRADAAYSQAAAEIIAQRLTAGVR